MSNKYKKTFKRPEPVIQPKSTGLDLIDDDFNRPLELFHSNTKYIRKLISDNIGNENILRYCIILICATMDKYMHDIEKTVILHIFRGKASPGKTFDSFLIPITLLNKFDKNNFNSEEKERILSEAIYEITASYTIQKSHSIERNLNYFLDFNVWKEIQPRMFMRFKFLNSITQTKKYIDNLVDRRNAIAHELDFMPNSETRNKLDAEYVTTALDVIQYFIESINYQIKLYIEKGPKNMDIPNIENNDSYEDSDV